MSVCADNELLVLYLLENAVLKEELDDVQKNRVLNILSDMNDEKYGTNNHVNYALRVLNKSCHWESFNHWKTIREVRSLREREDNKELSRLSSCL